MTSNFDFEELRPYSDAEVSKGLDKLIKEEKFLKIVHFHYPDWSESEMIAQLEKIKTIETFYEKLLHQAAGVSIKRTSDGLTFSGLEGLEPNKSYLFISNHRDILADSGFLNFILHNNKYKKVESIIGDNLVARPWIADLVKLNQNIVVKRNVSASELYQNSLNLSAYLFHALTQKQVSIWIAQREGRTKNGNDKTQPSVLKMISLINKKNPLEYFEKINVVPVSISYEYEPCVMNKVQELYTIEKTGKYEKAYDEDVRSMIDGATGYKGRVHFGFGKPIDPNDFKDLNRNEIFTTIAEKIDEQIYKNYKLFPNNFIAYDCLNEGFKFKEKYTAEQESKFTQHVYSELSHLPIERNLAKKIFWEIYANPVVNGLC